MHWFTSTFSNGETKLAHSAMNMMNMKMNME